MGKILLLLGILCLASCDKREAANYDAVYAMDEGVLSAKSTAETDFDVADESNAALDDNTERKIIKEGSITFETRNIQETRAAIIQCVGKYGGFITVDNANSGANERMEYRLTVRVPAAQFDALIDAVVQNATGRIDSKTVNVSDVTEEFIDVEARLKTKKDLESRYRALLQRAVKLEEILAIEREAGRLRSDIEALEGRMKYLKDKVAYSTLTVTCYELSPREGFRFGSKLTDAVHDGWRLTLWIVIGLFNIWPLILLTVAVWLMIRVAKRRRRNKKGKKLEIRN